MGTAELVRGSDSALSTMRLLAMLRRNQFSGTSLSPKTFAHETSQLGTRFEDDCGLNWRGYEQALILTRSSILAVEASQCHESCSY